jgi:hypothetical protein
VRPSAAKAVDSFGSAHDLLFYEIKRASNESMSILQTKMGNFGTAAWIEVTSMATAAEHSCTIDPAL